MFRARLSGMTSFLMGGILKHANMSLKCSSSLITRRDFRKLLLELREEGETEKDREEEMRRRLKRNSE